MNDAFSSYHPLVNFFYFALVLIFTMFFMHPVCLLISFISAIAYSICLKGKKAMVFNLVVILPMMVMTALINPLFNHQGATILTYLPSDNPLTLESIVYGLAAATMLAAVICWFACYNTVMTSDKFVYLFGRIIPAMSLVLTMILRFVPQFMIQVRVISNGQKCLGKGIGQGGIIQRAKHGIAILSILMTWALENAIETADSMKSRGYGLRGRTAFSIYKLSTRDKKALFMLVVLGGYLLMGSMLDGFYWRYFPTMQGQSISWLTISLWGAYLGLCLTPMAINWGEARRWKVTQSKT